MKTTTIARRRRHPREVATPRTAMRNFCLECMGWDAAEVKCCTAPACWLWPYRLARTGPVDKSDLERTVLKADAPQIDASKET
jgi:hypothetical protein